MVTKNPMTAAHVQHREALIAEIVERTRLKYARGRHEHGGKLWEKSGLLEEAINEAIDLLVYLLTLRKQSLTGRRK